MSTQPLVSVAIITYNQKEFLRASIESVLEQNYPNIEIVVADDGSTDGTQDMLREYERQYPDKFVLRLAEKNAGITANHNAAHFACSGKYVAWIGGDDLMLPGKLRKQVDFLEQKPDYNIVYHNLEVFESETGKVLRLYNIPRSKIEGGVEKLIRYGSFNGGCSTMVRRDKTPAYGFDTDMPVASDWFYWIESLRYGGKIGFIDEVLGKYRMHRKNVTNQSSAFYRQAIADHFLTLEKVSHYEKDYSKEIRYKRSNIYNDIRKLDYVGNLRTSLKYNFFNLKSWVYLSLYLLSFKKVKL